MAKEGEEEEQHEELKHPQAMHMASRTNQPLGNINVLSWSIQHMSQL